MSQPLGLRETSDDTCETTTRSGAQRRNRKEPRLGENKEKSEINVFLLLFASSEILKYKENFSINIFLNLTRQYIKFFIWVFKYISSFVFE